MGPRNGSFSVVDFGFFGFGLPPIFLIRASAAATRSARILSRCSSVKFSSNFGSGISSDFVVAFVVVVCALFFNSAAVPSRCPFPPKLFLLLSLAFCGVNRKLN